MPLKIFFCLLSLIPLDVFLGISAFRYVDEILVIAYVSYFICKKSSFSATDIKVMRLAFIVICIGFISNIQSGLIKNYFAILVDALWLLKIPASYLVMKHIGKTYGDGSQTKKLYPFAFAIITAMFVCGIISQFTNIGMTDGSRYGISTYSFIIGNAGYCGMWACVLFLICIFHIKNNIIIHLGELFVTTIIILTTKGIPFMALGTYWMYIIFRNKKNRLTIKSIIMIISVLILMASYQIDSYIKDINAPRMVLIHYGIKTANDFFPLGSGFASYGSEMAKRYYSPLYERYGFNNIWGLMDTVDNPEKDQLSCLNDIYYAGQAAQLGWVGFILYLLLFGFIFRDVYKSNLQNVKLKSMSLGIIVALYIASIASGMIKTALGVFGFSFIGYYVGYLNSKYLKHDS